MHQHLEILCSNVWLVLIYEAPEYETPTIFFDLFHKCVFNSYVALVHQSQDTWEILPCVLFWQINKCVSILNIYLLLKCNKLNLCIVCESLSFPVVMAGMFTQLRLPELYIMCWLTLHRNNIFRNIYNLPSLETGVGGVRYPPCPTWWCWYLSWRSC